MEASDLYMSLWRLNTVELNLFSADPIFNIGSIILGTGVCEPLIMKIIEDLSVICDRDISMSYSQLFYLGYTIFVIYAPSPVA